MEFWKKIKHELEAGHKVMLMYVLHSEGSSPGRQGFKMMVSDSSMIFGSIGGGVMEHKLVELCRKELSNKYVTPFIKRQIHQDNIAKDKSGMICSGEQTIAFYRLDSSVISMVSEIINAISNGKYGVFEATDQGISYNPGASLANRFEVIISNQSKWQLKEDIGYFPVLNIVGSGHVGLALSKFAHQLGFVVKVYDDREGLNTMEQNKDAECIHVCDYENIGDFLVSGPKAYVVLMSFGYRTDKIILRKLLDYDFKYLGMLGSKKKVKQLFKELMDEGVPEAQLEKIHAPIGIPIASKTPGEIAVSILGEIILVKNS